jgi:hypothetical protein
LLVPTESTFSHSAILDNFSYLGQPLKFLQEAATILKLSPKDLGDFLFWPKQALRKSFDSLNFSGPMGIAQYGVNAPITQGLSSHGDRNKIEFEFTVNADQIHIAHALNATYFPFFADDSKYSDHPYTLIMGNLLNFYKNTQMMNVNELSSANPSLELISIFDVNKFISVLEFEQDISSSVIRKGMRSLFSELNQLNPEFRKKRIQKYNTELEQLLSRKKIYKHGLDLAEDSASMFIPFLGTIKKILLEGKEVIKNKYPTIQSVSEYIEEKSNLKTGVERDISLLSKVSRVAKLKKDFK